MFRLKSPRTIPLFAAILVLVVAGYGIVSLGAGSFGSTTQAAAVDLAGYARSVNEVRESQRESDEDVARQAISCVPSHSGSYSLCCWDTPFWTVCWIETGAPALMARMMPEFAERGSPAASALQALANQPFTPHGL